MAACFMRAGTIISFGGRKVRHGFILQHAIGLGCLVPGKHVVIFHQRRGLQILQGGVGEARILGCQLRHRQAQPQLRRVGS